MNPFTQRGRITDPQHFIGRWRELSVIFDRLADGRPVIVTGVAGIGKSSLITHVAQSAAANLRQPYLEAFYIDLSKLETPEECYELIVRALGSGGNDSAALEVALLQTDNPVLISLDRAETAFAAGWGAELLERLARVARRNLLTVRPMIDPLALSVGTDSSVYTLESPGMTQTIPALLIVAANDGRPPPLSEPYAVVGIGVLSPSEVRLFTDAYLHDTDVRFTASELRELTTLSLGHAAYLQRAAFHLFQSRSDPAYDWRAAYLAEAQDRPVPGAPLPPVVFEGEPSPADFAAFSVASEWYAARPPEPLQLGGASDLLLFLLPLILALLVWQFTASWLATGSALLGAIALLALMRYLHSRRADTAAPDTPPAPDTHNHEEQS